MECKYSFIAIDLFYLDILVIIVCIKFWKYSRIFQRFNALMDTKNKTTNLILL